MRRRIPDARYAHSAERFYARSMNRLVDQMQGIIRHEMRQFNHTRRDSYESAEYIREMVNRMRVLTAGMLVKEAATMAGRFIRMVNSISSANFNAQTAAAGANPPGEPWLDTFMRDSIALNVRLIEALPGDLHDRLAKIIFDGVRGGTSNRDMERLIQAQLRVTRNKARFWARDQTGKILGQMNARRHQNAGITQFRWSDSGDESVRAEHSARNGRVYSYSDPPNGELPGEPYNCRCVAKPVFDFELEDERLSDDEENALNRYISSDAYKLNDELRRGNVLSTDFEEMRRNLDSALNKMPQFNGDLQRTILLSDDGELRNFLRSHQVGETVNFPAYTSFSAGTLHDPDANIRMHIQNSTQGLDLRSFNPGENEVLYRRDTNFKVVDFEIRGSINHILLEELP